MSAISPGALYERYSAWTENAKAVPVKPSFFRKVFLDAKAKLSVKVRASKQGTKQCALCSLINDTMAQSKRISEVRIIPLLLLLFIVLNCYR